MLIPQVDNAARPRSAARRDHVHPAGCGRASSVATIFSAARSIAATVRGSEATPSTVTSAYNRIRHGHHVDDVRPYHAGPW